MRHQKRFWQGALCGALAVLLGLGLVSCAGRLPFLGKEEAVSQETKEKLSGIQALIQKEYIGEVDEDALQTGICQGYVGALGDPYSAYYDEEGDYWYVELGKTPQSRVTDTEIISELESYLDGDGSQETPDIPTSPDDTSQIWTDEGNYATSFAGGDGSENNPWQIATPAQLARMAYLVNNSDTNADYRSDYYVQTANLDMSAYYWDSIGTSSSIYFSGHYDGGNYTIFGLCIANDGQTSTSNRGLFGYIGYSNNIVLAIKEALAKGMKVIFFTSEKCNSLDNENMVILKVPSSITPRIQEIHIMLIHYLCEEIENYFMEEKNEK